MDLLRTISDTREVLNARVRAARSIGFVPTMGYLHEGHLSLVDRCRALTDVVVISIYVNPLQFGPNEDLDAYPRDLTRDLEVAEARGVDLVFAPTDDELYPSPPAVVVVPKRLADRLCGLSRPGHFEGVLTVVAKLFNIVQPDVAVFGHKDFQQSVLVRHMVTNLDLPVRVEVAPTVRDADGLALSSRNEYLSREGRSRALGLSKGLADAVRAFRSGERDAGVLKRRARAAMGGDRAADRVEYVECVSPDELEPVDVASEASVLAVAAHVSGTRLIDNTELGRPDPGLERLLQRGGGA